MNLRVTILVLSLVGNIVLASFVVRHRDVPTSLATNIGANSQVASATHGKTVETVSSDVNSGAVLAGAGQEQDSQSGFRWSQLEAADYKEYIAKLRAFGVPEKVIRDIIIADVTKLYRPRLAALRPPKKPKNPNFWETRNRGYYPDREMTKEQREQMRQVQKEQTNLIKELLGGNVYEEMAKDSGYPDWSERMYGPLSKEDREKIGDMQQRFQEAQSEIYAKADGYIDRDTQSDLAALRKKFRNELATVLTPEQLQEYELRSSETAQRMRWELSSFEPDEKEFRAIHSYKQAMDDFNTAGRDEDKPLTPEEKAQQKEMRDKQKTLEAALTEAIGTNRFREYKLMDRYEYRNLLDAGVPKESVFKITDIKAEVDKAASKLRQDKTLSTEQRNAALQAIETETQQTLIDLLGERRAKSYQANGVWWLRNLVPQAEQP